MQLRVWPGRPNPLGATWDGGGVNFAIFSEHATQVAREAGFERLAVISAIGTREYYRKLGFEGGALYMARSI